MGLTAPGAGMGCPRRMEPGLAPCVPRPWAWAPASQPDGLCSETGLRPLDSSRLCPLLPGGGCALSRGTGPDLGAGPWPGLSRSWLSVFPRSAGNTGRPSLPAPAAATRRPLHVKPPPTQRWPRGSGPSSLTPAPCQPSGPAAPASRSAPARDTLDRHLGVAVGRAWAPKPGFHGALHDLLDETQSCSDSLGSRTPGPVGAHGPGPPQARALSPCWHPKGRWGGAGRGGPDSGGAELPHGSAHVFQPQVPAGTDHSRPCLWHPQPQHSSVHSAPYRTASPEASAQAREAWLGSWGQGPALGCCDPNARGHSRPQKQALSSLPGLDFTPAGGSQAEPQPAWREDRRPDSRPHAAAQPPAGPPRTPSPRRPQQGLLGAARDLAGHPPTARATAARPAPRTRASPEVRPAWPTRVPCHLGMGQALGSAHSRRLPREATGPLALIKTTEVLDVRSMGLRMYAIGPCLW